MKLKRKAKERFKKKVTRKLHQNKYIHPKKITEGAIKKTYDKNKTMLENLRKTDLKEMFGKNLPTHIPEQPLNPPKVNEVHAAACAKLVARFGEDYSAMSRFHKINTYQWTEKECKRKVEMWKAGQVSQYGCMDGHDKKTVPVEGKVVLRKRCPR